MKTSANELRIPAGDLLLRDFRPMDVETVHAIIGDDRVTQFLSFDSRSIDEARLMISRAMEAAQQEPREEYYVAITTQALESEVVGFVRLALTGVKAAKLGYAISFPYQGRGIASCAVSAMVSFGLDQLGVHRISAAIGPDNAASLAVIKKLEFTLEGRLRDHVFTNGGWRDSLLFSKLTTD